MKYKLGCIGVGTMGGAVLAGAVSSGRFQPGDIACYNRSEEKRSQSRELGYNVLEDESAVWQSCEVVLISIKPQGMDELLSKLGQCPPCSPLVVSVVAGVSEEKIHSNLPGVPVILAMPNTPLVLGCGATALAKGKGVTREDFDMVMDIFASMGEAREIPADKMNEIIPINGSAPAFVYYFIDTLARWGESCGVTYEACLALAAKTFEGAAKMVLEGGKNPEELIKKVCSPGGTTLEGLRVMDEYDVKGILAEVARACVDRAYELGK